MEGKKHERILEEALQWVTSERECGRWKGEDILSAVVSSPFDPNLKIEDRFLIRLNSINCGGVVG